MYGTGLHRDYARPSSDQSLPLLPASRRTGIDVCYEVVGLPTKEKTSTKPEPWDWLRQAQALVTGLQLETRVRDSENQIRALTKRLTELEEALKRQSTSSVCIPISTLAP